MRKRGTSGAVLPAKQRMNIYLDSDIVEHFKAEAGERGYQTLINEALKNAIQPRILSWTGVSVRFCSFLFLARRDDEAGFTLLGGATLPGSCKSVQSHP